MVGETSKGVVESAVSLLFLILRSFIREFVRVPYFMFVVYNFSLVGP